MEQQVFCDGIGRISIIGGVVRLDLYTYSPNETDTNGSPRPILTHRIVMGTDGFLRSSEKIMEAVQAIGRQRSQPAPASAQAAPSPTQAASQPQWPPPQLQPQQTPQPAPQQSQSPQPSAPQSKSPEPPPVRPPFP